MERDTHAKLSDPSTNARRGRLPIPDKETRARFEREQTEIFQATKRELERAKVLENAPLDWRPSDLVRPAGSMLHGRVAVAWHAAQKVEQTMKSLQAEGSRETLLDALETLGAAAAAFKACVERPDIKAYIHNSWIRSWIAFQDEDQSADAATIAPKMARLLECLDELQALREQSSDAIAGARSRELAVLYGAKGSGSLTHYSWTMAEHDLGPEEINDILGCLPHPARRHTPQGEEEAEKGNEAMRQRIRRVREKLAAVKRTR